MCETPKSSASAMRMIFCATKRRLRSRPVASDKMPSRTSLLILSRAVRGVTWATFAAREMERTGCLKSSSSNRSRSVESRSGRPFDVLLLKFKQPFPCGWIASTDCSATPRRKNSTGPPFAALAHGQKKPVVFLPVLFEKRGKIKQRLIEQFLRTQDQRDQKPADAPVAIEIGMYGFELIMHQGKPNKCRKCGGSMDKAFELSKRLFHLMDWRGHVGGIIQRATRGTNPILRAAEFAGRKMLPATRPRAVREVRP